jgi:hypothetical protein
MEKGRGIPPRPQDDPGEGKTWVWDDRKGWHEVDIEIRMPGDEPFFPKDTPPLNLPEDKTPPGPQSPN